ncbi:MAG: translocation/assembly module TamB [Chitinophagaceae bacterium]|nr:translocation/assembly module TamB [Chitinophagaceae bacterium]
MGKATSWLSDKLKTSVQLEEINLTFPKSVYLKNFYIADLRSDTLLFIHELSVDISMKSLLKNQAIINSVTLNGATAHLTRTLPDSSFNFDFIAAAFSSSSPEPEVADTGASSFNLLLGKATLDNIHFTLQDAVGGMVGVANIGHLDVNFKDFDLANQKMLVDELNWNNSMVHFYQNKPVKSDTTASSPLTIQLGAKHIHLANLDLVYADTTTQLSLSSKITLLEADPDTIDISRLIFDFKKLKAEQTSFYVAIGTSSTVDTSFSGTSDSSATALMAKCDQLTLSGFDFRFDDKTAVPVTDGIDYSHLDVKDVTGKFSNIFYQGINIAVDINEIKASEKCGLNIKEGFGKLRMTETGVSFDSCLLVTDKSTIRNGAGIRYSSLEDISDDIGKLGVYGNMKNATIAVSDILYFYPPLAENEYVKPSINRSLTIDGNISGTLNNLQFKNLKVRTGATDALVSGSIKGLPDADKMVMDIKLSRFSSTKAELMALLPDSLLPSSIEIPASFTLSGNYSGTMENFKSALFLESSFGNAMVVANMEKVAGKDIQHYDAKVDLENFNLGKLLKQEETIGIVNLSATAEGEGFTVEEMNATVNAHIKSLQLKDYEYRDVEINGKIADKSFNGDVSINDDAIAFTFDGAASLSADSPAYNFLLDVKYADLQALHLYDDDLKFSGKVTGNFTGNDLSTLNGTIFVSDAAIASGGKITALDSISLKASSNEGKYDWTFRSQIVDADYAGTSSAAIGIPLLINHFNYYFNSQTYREADTLGQQSFDFAIRVHDQKNLLPVFITDLNRIDPFQISGSFNSASKELKVVSTPTDIIYSGNLIDSLVLFAESTPEKLSYSVAVNKLQHDTLQINRLSLTGFVRNDSIYTVFAIKPDTNHVDLVMGASLSSSGNNIYRMHLFPDQLVFDNQKWLVPEDNFLQWGPQGLWSHNLKISNDSSYLLVQSTEEHENAPLNFTFNNFDLSIFSQIIDTSAQVFTGIINGDFLLKDFKTFTFNSALTIDDFSFLNNEYGNLALNAENNDPGKYDVKLTLLGAGNGVNVEGFYRSNAESSELHFDALIDSANFSLVAPFAYPYVRDLNGTVKGKLSIRGSTDAPLINGSVSFDSAGFVLSYTNTALNLGKETISLDGAGIHFNGLSLIDLNGNKATINGALFTKDYRNYQFGIDLKANDFTLMNSTSEVITDYYGLLKIDCNASLRGDIDRPSVDVRLKLREGTNVTYIYQRSDTTFNTEEGMVEFISGGDRLDSILAAALDTVPSVFSGYSITAAVEVDDKSQFNIVVDPVAGDKLQLKGNGSFNYDVNPSGRTTLTGRYEISEGSYNLTLYNVVKKQFILDKGSFISWTGDLLDADIDIRGHMDVRTSPYALIGAQAAGATDEQQAQYKNPLDFDVFLIMQNKLLSPDISFDIQLDDRDAGALDGIVDAKLAELQKQEGEMNKQVFALMVLGTFVAADPTASTGASQYLNDVAKSSVSNILSSQLNKLSSQYIKGVDVNFDLKSVTDYSNGYEEEKTQLNVGVREQLFNDRLQIYVGTNFDIGGSSAFTANPSDLSGDFSMEYLLRPDGRVRLNLFRKGSYEGIFEGQTIENGLSVIYNRDFNSFRQLFIAGKELAADKRKKKEDEKAK